MVPFYVSVKDKDWVEKFFVKLTNTKQDKLCWTSFVVYP